MVTGSLQNSRLPVDWDTVKAEDKTLVHQVCHLAAEATHLT